MGRDRQSPLSPGSGRERKGLSALRPPQVCVRGSRVPGPRTDADPRRLCLGCGNKQSSPGAAPSPPGAEPRRLLNPDGTFEAPLPCWESPGCASGGPWEGGARVGTGLEQLPGWPRGRLPGRRWPRACGREPCSALVPTDAELPGAHVPRPRPGQGLQHQPHHAQEVAGKCPLLNTLS